MAEKEAVIDTFEDVQIDFSNLASNYSPTEDITVFVNPIPRHRIAESDCVQLEKVFDGGTKVVYSVRPHYDEQLKRWTVSITASAIGPGTFRLTYAKGQGLVLATSHPFTITQSGPGLEVPPEDETNSQGSVISSFVTVSDQEEESFTAVSESKADPTEKSRFNEWEDLGAQLLDNPEGVSPSLSHQTSSRQSPAPACSTNSTSVTELVPHTNSDHLQSSSSNKPSIEESSDFTYVPSTGGEEHQIAPVCDSDEEKSKERELVRTSVSDESCRSPSRVSSVSHAPSDPVAITTSRSCQGVPSLSQSVVLVDYISQAEAKAALRNNKEMMLKIAKLKKKITSERQLHQQLKDELESRDEEILHLKERLASVQKDTGELRAQLRTRDHKIIDMEDGIKKLEEDKQRYQQLNRELHAKLDSYKLEVHRLNQATKTYQTQMKLLHTENTVLRQRSATGSNVARISSPPPRAHSPPKQHMVTGITTAPGLRMASNFPVHRQRERHQAEPPMSRVHPSGLGTEHVYQPGFGFKGTDQVPSQHEHDKESELHKGLTGDKESIIQCPVCNLTMPARGNQHTLTVHVEACLKNKGYD